MNRLLYLYGWFYTQLLKLYPAGFYADFGEGMRQVFTQALADCAAPGKAVHFCLHELADLPGALLRQYLQRPVWALSAAGSFPDESARLEARFRRDFYRRQFFTLLKASLVIMLVIIAVPVHGYLYTAYTLHQSVQEFGAYSTVDEAIHKGRQYERYYRNIRSISVISEGPNDKGNDFIWYVIAEIHAESMADGSPIRHSTLGGSFYVRTKDGWVYYRENLWVALGFLSEWMNFYHLYGEGD